MGQDNTPNVNPPTKKELAFSMFSGLVTFLIGIFLIMCFTTGGFGTSSKADSTEYVKYTADELINDYESPEKSKAEHKNEYVEVQGVLLDVYASDTEFRLTGFDEERLLAHYYIDCFSTSKQHDELIDNMSDGDVVTLKGKITDVNQYCYTIAIHELEVTAGSLQEDKEHTTETSLDVKDNKTYNIIYSGEPLIRPTTFF